MLQSMAKISPDLIHFTQKKKVMQHIQLQHESKNPMEKYYRTHTDQVVQAILLISMEHHPGSSSFSS